MHAPIIPAFLKGHICSNVGTKMYNFCTILILKIGRMGVSVKGVWIVPSKQYHYIKHSKPGVSIKHAYK